MYNINNTFPGKTPIVTPPSLCTGTGVCASPGIPPQHSPHTGLDAPRADTTPGRADPSAYVSHLLSARLFGELAQLSVGVLQLVPQRTHELRVGRGGGRSSAGGAPTGLAESPVSLQTLLGYSTPGSGNGSDTESRRMVMERRHGKG